MAGSARPAPPSPEGELLRHPTTDTDRCSGGNYDHPGHNSDLRLHSNDRHGSPTREDAPLRKPGNMDKVVHLEIPFDGKKRAMKFYADVFDRKRTDTAQMSYVMAETTAGQREAAADRARRNQRWPFPAPKGGPPGVVAREQIR